MARPDEGIITEIMLAEGESARVMSLDSIDSTNNEVKRYAGAGGTLPVVITADRQTAGRGRLGRSFYSPAATGAYFSVGFRVTGDLKSAVTITSAAAVAAARAIERTTGLRVGIKWVNDLYLNGGKVCGILAESFAVPDGLAVVVGVGINLSTEHFPDEIAHTAASLGRDGVRDALIARTAAGILAYSRAEPDAFIDEYRARSIVLGREVSFFSVGTDPRPATAIAIDNEGGLVVRLPDGAVETLRTGEISVRIKE